MHEPEPLADKHSIAAISDDDSHPFLSAQIPVITIHSMTQETLHSDRDLVAAIDFDSYYETYRLAAFYLARLDASDIE